MAIWQLGLVHTAVAATAPVASAHPPERERHELDAAAPSKAHDYPLHLTAEEVENGCVMPVWPRIRHVSCGLRRDLPHIDMARGLAQDPRRPMLAAKGFACLHPRHQHLWTEEDGQRCPPFFPIEGDLRSRPGEWIWLDWHGRDTPFRVGHIPAGRTVVRPGQTLGQLMDHAKKMLDSGG